MLKLNTASFAIVFILFGLSFSTDVSAQNASYSLQQAIEKAKENYPSIKAANLEIEKQKALKTTAYDFGQTSIYTGKEEVGNNMPGIQNKIGIEQTGIDIFSMPAKSSLSRARVEKAVAAQNLTEFMLVRDVRIAWYKAVKAKQQLELYKQLDTLFANFENAAQLRFKTHQSSKIEYLSASAKYKELLLNIKKAENYYTVALQNLNQYLGSSESFDVEIEDLEKDVFIFESIPDSLLESPVLNYLENNINIAEVAYKVEKSMLLPKLNLGYKLQLIDGTSGFYGWEVGFSIPLVFFSQSGKNKASKINIQITQAEFERSNLEIQSNFKQLISLYNTLKEVVNFYKKEALPLANEQIQASNLAYKLGSIDYVQFIQNVEAAINTKQEFINKQTEYFILSAQLKYITGK